MQGDRVKRVAALVLRREARRGRAAACAASLALDIVNHVKNKIIELSRKRTKCARMQILSAPTCKTLSRAQNCTISLSEAWPCPQSRCRTHDSEGPIGSINIFSAHRTGVRVSVHAW